MQPETGDIHVLYGGGGIQGGQLEPELLYMIGVYADRIPGLVKTTQSLVPERLNYNSIMARCASGNNSYILAIEMYLYCGELGWDMVSIVVSLGLQNHALLTVRSTTNFLSRYPFQGLLWPDNRLSLEWIHPDHTGPT